MRPQRKCLPRANPKSVRARRIANGPWRRRTEMSDQTGTVKRTRCGGSERYQPSARARAASDVQITARSITADSSRVPGLYWVEVSALDPEVNPGVLRGPQHASSASPATVSGGRWTEDGDAACKVFAELPTRDHGEQIAVRRGYHASTCRRPFHHRRGRRCRPAAAWQPNPEPAGRVRALNRGTACNQRARTSRALGWRMSITNAVSSSHKIRRIAAVDPQEQLTLRRPVSLYLCVHEYTCSMSLEPVCDRISNVRPLIRLKWRLSASAASAEYRRSAMIALNASQQGRKQAVRAPLEAALRPAAILTTPDASERVDHWPH